MEEQVIIKKPRAEHSSLNIKDLFFKYVRFLPLYIICVAIALVGAYVYLRYSTEYYRSTGQLVIKNDNNSGRMQDDRVAQIMQADRSTNIQTEIEILQSRPLMERAVDELGLNFNYYSTGKIKELDIYKRSPLRVEPIELADSSQSFTLRLTFLNQNNFKVNGAGPYATGQEFRLPNGKFRIVRVNNGEISSEIKIVYNPTPVQAGMLLSGLVVVPKQNTGILTIAMESTNPSISADVINALMNEYQKVTIEDKNASTKKSIDFINSNLREREKELDSITQKLVSYREAHNAIDPGVQASNYFSRIEEAHKLTQQQRIQLNNALQLQDYLRSNSQAVVPSSLGIDDPTLNTLISDYNKAQLEQKELLENAQPGHIVVQQKKEEADVLRNKILENIGNIKSSYNRALGTLQSSSNEAVSQIKMLPSKQQDLLDIQNQLEGKLKIYNQLLSKREEQAITLASTISNTKVMQEAIPDSTPVKPDRRSTQILAFFIGLLVPTIIIVVLELLNDKINSRHDIERLTDATILGEVGHSFDGRTLVVTSGNRRVIAEQFRILRSNLQYILTKAPKPVIMVTSSFSGEGKSFVSTNMGAVMALANKKTIILEFDIRKPKIVSGLGMSKQPGLTNFILGKVNVSQLPVQVGEFENLFVLPCGPIPPNPGELLLDSKLDDLFVYLKENFDVVIMDTAPVGMVSDALTLSKYADCTLYIVRQGHTYKKQIGLVDEYYQEGKLPKVSVVLNDVKVQAGYGGYGYGRNYGYGYGAGYFDDEPESQSGFQKWFGWLGIKNGNGVEKKNKRKKV
ncbi:MAG: polysaccharide biosynthesis tyrosine autokinase [Chitinophagaceae bacterium]|nr:MAG: polysaccharide biosynthesis tyrosine autokinase [Chitinophagaceae bacterium]